MVCQFCLVEPTDSFFGSYCARCHKMQRLLHLMGGEKIMSVLETVLLVDEPTQKEKIKEELKAELTTREYHLRSRKQDA